MLRITSFAALLFACIAALMALGLSWPMMVTLQEGSVPGPGLAAGWLGSLLVLAGAVLARRRLRRLAGEHRGRHSAAAMDAGMLEARGKRLFLIGLGLVGALGVLSMAFGIGAGQPVMILGGLLFLILALGQALIWAPAVRRGGVMLRMDSSGIDFAACRPIPWSEVIGLGIHRQSWSGVETYALLVGVHSPQKYLRGTLPGTPYLLGRLFGGHTIGIPLNILECDPVLVHTLALALRRRVPGLFTEYWWRGMTATELEAGLRMKEVEDEGVALLADIESGRCGDHELEERINGHDERLREVQAGLTAALDVSRRRMRREQRIMVIVILAAMLFWWLGR